MMLPSMEKLRHLPIMIELSTIDTLWLSCLSIPSIYRHMTSSCSNSSRSAFGTVKPVRDAVAALCEFLLTSWCQKRPVRCGIAVKNPSAHNYDLHRIVFLRARCRTKESTEIFLLTCLCLNRRNLFAQITRFIIPSNISPGSSQ